MAKLQVKRFYPPQSVRRWDRSNLIWSYIVLKATFILLFTSYFAFIITYFPF
jgi:hypothetical protein